MYGGRHTDKESVGLSEQLAMGQTDRQSGHMSRWSIRWSGLFLKPGNPDRCTDIDQWTINPVVSLLL